MDNLVVVMLLKFRKKIWDTQTDDYVETLKFHIDLVFSSCSARELAEENQQKPSKPPTPDKATTDLSIVKIESDEDEETGAMEMYINMSGAGGESIRVQRADHGDQEEGGEPHGDWMREDLSNEDSNVSGDQSNSWLYPPGSQAQYKGGYTNDVFFSMF